jgi:Zn-dependent peptidase ImmA (M78 family)
LETTRIESKCGPVYGEKLLEAKLKAYIVMLIANGDTEKALQVLAENHKISVPKLRVGLPKGRKKKALGTYSPKNQTISVLDSDTLKQPFIILHEFYHHLRTTVDLKHKGTEKNANAFANDFVQAYKSEIRLSLQKRARAG